MIQSETIAKLATALAKAQALIKPASKDAVNPHFKSKYADLTAIWEACREPLTSQGLSVSQIPVSGDPGYLSLMTMLMHESGEYIGGVFSVRLAQDTAQAMGSALTYARRYALSALVGIVADDDDDGNEASKPQTPRIESRGTRTPDQAPSPRSARPAQPQRPASPNREGMIKRIQVLAQEAKAKDITIERVKPYTTMTDAELLAHGKALSAALELAEGGSPQ
jgi:hypothetical protein